MVGRLGGLKRPFEKKYKITWSLKALKLKILRFSGLLGCQLGYHGLLKVLAFMRVQYLHLAFNAMIML